MGAQRVTGVKETDRDEGHSSETSNFQLLWGPRGTSRPQGLPTGCVLRDQVIIQAGCYKMPDCQPMQGHWVSRKVFSQHQEIVSHVTLGDNVGKLQDTAQSAAPTFTAYSTSPWCPPPPDSVGVSHCKTGCIRYAAQLMFWLGH